MICGHNSTLILHAVRTSLGRASGSPSHKVVQYQTLLGRALEYLFIKGPPLVVSGHWPCPISDDHVITGPYPIRGPQGPAPIKTPILCS